MKKLFFRLPNGLIAGALTLILLCSTFYADSQTKLFYISEPASIVIHPNASLNIFLDITNAGTFKSYNNSTITFYAQKWQNIGDSSMPDESTTGLDSIGGNFVFSGIFSNAQTINVQNPQPFTGFPNITINNTQHVTAQAGNLYINRNLNFIRGNLILGNVDATVGRSGKGTITGYSQNGFVVTGTGITGGYLVRPTTGAQGPFVFPIGTSNTSYSPVSLTYTGKAQNLKLRVADNVYNKLAFPEYVNKTWVLATDFPDPTASADITLQHRVQEEGMKYSINRIDNYITRYDKNLTGLWDILAPSASVSPGTITTGPVISGAFVNTRTGIKKLAPVEYFSKSVIKEFVDPSTPSFIAEAFSPNGDGRNDTYTIVKRLPTDVIRLEIFTRNQILVYKDVNYQNTFDGSGNMGGFSGSHLPDGIYYYVISANGAKALSGYIVINR